MKRPPKPWFPSEDVRFFRQAIQLLSLLVGLALVGTIGFQVIEGWNFFDSLFMAVITLTTVGYGEVHPLSHLGRLFVICYIVMGMGLFLFGIIQLGEVVLRMQLRDWLGRRKMDLALKQLRKHFIVCGFGRMGRTLAHQFAEKNVPFVVIDKDEETLAVCQENGWHFVRGDATDDEILDKAGLATARGLAAVLGNDADNLYVVLSARLINSKLTIIARATDEKARRKLEQAGATRVVSLYSAGAMKVASLLINPNVEEFVETLSGGEKDISLAEIAVTANSPFAGKALSKTDFSRRGVVIVGLRRGGGELLLPVPSHEEIRVGDTLIAMGKTEVMGPLMPASSAPQMVPPSRP